MLRIHGVEIGDARAMVELTSDDGNPHRILIRLTPGPSEWEFEALEDMDLFPGRSGRWFADLLNRARRGEAIPLPAEWDEDRDRD